MSRADVATTSAPGRATTVLVAPHAPAARLLVVTPWWPSSAQDAWGSFVRDQAMALSRAGADVRVAVVRLRRSLRSTPLAPFPARGNGPGERPPKFEGPWLPYARAYEAILGIWERGISRALLSQGSWGRSATVVVHTQDLAVPAMRALDRVGAPFVLVAHGLEPDSPRYVNGSRFRRYRCALEAAQRVVAVGPGLARVLSREAPRADVRTVLNGYDEDLVRRIEAEPAAAQIAPRLVSVGNLVPGKGVNLVLAALESRRRRGLDVPRYDVVGDGPERVALERWAKEHGILDRLAFHGRLDHASALRVVRGATAFVLPSSPEACGIASMEAMALGVPPLAVRGEGPSAFVEDGVEGRLVESTPESVTKGVDDLLADPSATSKLGAAAKRRAASLGWELSARRFLDVLPARKPVAPRPPRHVVAFYIEPTPYISTKLDLVEASGRVVLRRAYAGTDRSQPWGAEGRSRPHEILGSPRRAFSLAVDLARGKFDGLHVGGWGGARVSPLLLGAAWLGRTPLTLESDTHRSRSRGMRAFARRAYLRLLDRRVRSWLPGGSPQAAHLANAVGVKAPVRIERMTTDTPTLLAEAKRLGPDAGKAWRAEHGVPPGAPLVLYVGRIAPEKGLADLSAAVGILGREDLDLWVALVGPGDPEPLYSHDLPRPRVVAPGRLAWRDLVPVYLAADVLVLPSRFEPWGLVVNEALLLGCPAVVTEAVGAAADLVASSGTGEVVPVRNPEALARALRGVLSRGGRASKDAARGREVMKAWSTEGAAATLVDVLDRRRPW